MAQAFGEAAQELERLAQDHATGMAKTEQALAGAASEEDARPLRDEARRHVEAIREAAEPFPPSARAATPGRARGRRRASWPSRWLARSRRGGPRRAVAAGRSALGTLDEVERILQRASRREDVGGEKQRRVEDVQRRLDAEAKWAEEAARELRRRTAERARDSLQQSGQAEERMADRARNLGERGRERASFPQQAVEAIEEAARAAREAARALSEGETDRGLEREREAQRRLEAAREQLQDDQEGEDAERGGDGNDRSPGHDSVAIPNANEHKGPEEFRRRVMRGLGLRSSGALKDAVRRYAEGLLRDLGQHLGQHLATGGRGSRSDGGRGGPRGAASDEGPEPAGAARPCSHRRARLPRSSGDARCCGGRLADNPGRARTARGWPSTSSTATRRRHPRAARRSKAEVGQRAGRHCARLPAGHGGAHRSGTPRGASTFSGKTSTTPRSRPSSSRRSPRLAKR